MPTEPLTEKFAGYNDPIFYIYTSGTTGMPKVELQDLDLSYSHPKALGGAFSVIVKTDCETDGSFYSTIYKVPLQAAIIKHSRYLFASYCLFCMGLTYPDDILYSVLPMYHSGGYPDIYTAIPIISTRQYL